MMCPNKKKDGRTGRIGCWSGILAEPEKKLATTQKERLAIVSAIVFLRHYLVGVDLQSEQTTKRLNGY